MLQNSWFLSTKKIFFFHCLSLLCISFLICGPVKSADAAEDKAGQAQELGEITVTGDQIEDFISQNPSQVVSMGAAEIEKRNFLQVQEVLGTMSGVDVKTDSSGLGTRISIRGGAGSGPVLVLIDGRPAATLQYGRVDLSSIPIDIVSKIIVFKPPVPVWLGPGSAAGAVYIETRQKKQKNKGGEKGKIRALAGSFGLFSASATGQVDTADSQFLVSGGASHKDGKRENSQKDLAHLSFGYNKKKEGRQIQANAKTYVSDRGVSGPTYNLTPDAQQKCAKTSFDLKYKGYKDDTDYTLKAWTDIKKLDETAQNGDESSLDTLAAGVGADFFLPGNSKDDEIKIGGIADYNQVDHTLTGEHDRTRMGTHAEYNLRSRPFVYTLGARADYTNDFDFSPGGHAGVSYEFSKETQIKANAGYTENIPSFGQLYQSTHGSIDQVRGNPDLDPERIVSLNIGVDHSFSKNHQFSIALFRTDCWDLIKYQRDSNNISSPQNVDRAYKHGLETSLTFVFSDMTEIELNYILQTSENKDNGKYLSYTPSHTGKLVFKTAFKTKTRLEWIMRAYSTQYTDNENDETEKLDPYMTTDIKLAQPLTLFKLKALGFVNIHNLFDKDYSSHYGYPDDGIRVEIGLSLNF